MTRPMTVIGFSFFVTLVVVNFACSQYPLAVFAVCAALLMALMPIKKVRQAILVPTALLSAAVACLLFYAFNHYSYEPAMSLVGESVNVRGNIVSVPTCADEYGKYRYIIKTDSVDAQKRSVYIRLSTSEALNAEYNWNISFTGTVYELGSHDMEIARYYKSQKLYLGAYTFSGITVSQSTERPIYYYVLYEKQKLLNSITSYFSGDNAGLLAALLFGEKSLLSQTCLENMRKAGISHLMAVSGLHMGVWVLLILRLLEKRRVKPKIYSVICSAIVLGVMAFSSFSTSVMRAGLMTLLYLLGVFIGRKSEGFNSLGFAALCLMLFNPYVVCDVSFLLTVCAAAGILFASYYVLPKAESLVRAKAPSRVAKLLRALLSVVILSVFAQVFTLPVTIFTFGTFCPYGVISNVLISLPAMICMIGAGILPFVSFITPVSAGLVWALKILSSYITGTAGVIASLPFAELRADYQHIYLWLAISILAFCFVGIFSDNKWYWTTVTACCSLIILFSCTIAYRYDDSTHVRITAVDVGNGTAVLLTHNGRGCLIGCGGDYYAASAMNDAIDKRNVTLDYIFIPDDSEYQTSVLDEIAATNASAKVVHCKDALEIDTKLWNCVRLRTKSGDNYMYADIYSTRLVMNFMYASRLKYATAEDRGDILISRNCLPEGIDYEDYKSVVLQKEEIDENIYPCFVTGRDGDILIRVGSKKYSVWRYSYGNP